jgi:hypothetical protein
MQILSMKAKRPALISFQWNAFAAKEVCKKTLLEVRGNCIIALIITGSVFVCDLSHVAMIVYSNYRNTIQSLSEQKIINLHHHPWNYLHSPRICVCVRAKRRENFTFSLMAFSSFSSSFSTRQKRFFMNECDLRLGRETDEKKNDIIGWSADVCVFCSCLLQLLIKTIGNLSSSPVGNSSQHNFCQWNFLMNEKVLAVTGGAIKAVQWPDYVSSAGNWCLCKWDDVEMSSNTMS